MLIPYKQVAVQTELQNSQISAADFLFFGSCTSVDTGRTIFSHIILPLPEGNHQCHIREARQHCDTINWQWEKSLLSVSTSLSEKKAIVIMPTISLMRDQIIQVNEHGIKVAYMGSAAKYQPATTEALKSTSDVQIIFVTPEWLFTEQLDNVSKLKVLEEADQLSLIALDEAHLMYEWNSFRPLYIRCQDLPSLFPDTPVMVLSATVTPEIMSKLQSFLRNPVIEKGSVYRSNIYIP